MSKVLLWVSVLFWPLTKLRFELRLEFKYKRSGEDVRQMSAEEIRALPEVIDKFADGKTQLLDYEKRLKHKYGDHLQIETITVVTLGFEKVMWEKTMVNDE